MQTRDISYLNQLYNLTLKALDQSDLTALEITCDRLIREFGPEETHIGNISKADLYYKKALGRFKNCKGSYSLCIKDLKEAIKLEPGNIDYQVLLFNCQYVEKKYQGAYATLSVLETSHSIHRIDQEQRAFILYKAEKYADALDLYETLIPNMSAFSLNNIIHPVEDLFYMGELSFLLQYYRKAEMYLSEYIEATYDRPITAYGLLGSAKVFLGDYTEGKAYLSTYLDYSKLDLIGAAEALNICDYALGEPTDLEQIWACINSPDITGAWLLVIGKVCLKNANYDAATSAFKKLQTLDRENQLTPIEREQYLAHRREPFTNNSLFKWAKNSSQPTPYSDLSMKFTS